MSCFKSPVFIFISACLVLFSFVSPGVSLDWSGFSRLEAYYQHSSNYYGNYQLVLQPKIQVLDGLDITGRFYLNSLDLKTREEAIKPLSSQGIQRQTGPVFIYNQFKQEDLFEYLFFNLSQFYLNYQDEFFKIRLGRAPYHFGMGLTYSASENPFHHWINVYNLAALHLELSSFYFQPAVLQEPAGQDRDKLSALAQAGAKGENWELALLYRYNKIHFIEAFGEYKKEDKWEIKATGATHSNQGDQTNLLLALEAKMPFNLKIPFEVGLNTGGAFGDLSFHPNYNVALLFWNRWISPENKKDSFYIAEGQIQQGLYFSPQIVFSFFEEELKIRSLVLLARDLDNKTWSYELDLEGLYQLNKNFFLSLKGGGLYTDKNFYFALLAQAAVSF